MPDWITRAFEGVGRVAPVRLRSRAAADDGNPSVTIPRHAEVGALCAAAVNPWDLAFLATDRDGVISAWNSGAEKLFGYRAAEAIGRDIESVVRPDGRDEAGVVRDKFCAGRRIGNFAAARLTKDGMSIHVIFDIAPVRSPADEWVGSCAIVRDVTGQRLAEELFRLAVDACPSGMMMIDGGGRIVMVNPEVECLFGYRRDELIGRPVEMLVPPSVRVVHAALRDRFAKRPESRKMGKGRDLVGLRKDGCEFPVEIALSSVQIRDGLLILAVIVDITERKQNERLKDEFVATVSHELRTPLTSIAASLALLTAEKGGQLPPLALRLVTIAHENGQRLVRLVNDILEIERIESGSVVFGFRQVNARAIVEQAIEASRAYADQVGVKLRLEPSERPCEVWADPDRLAQVVTNLLSNAIKFSPAGGAVVLAVCEQENRVRITVRDHGPGIPEEFKPRIFTKFAQADGTDARQKGGAGLGLSIVKQIVDRLGGDVGFESATGGGTQFFVELPQPIRGEGEGAGDAGLVPSLERRTETANSRS